MPHRMLSYQQFWEGFLDTEYLIFILDFAMWLEIEHDGKPKSTPVSLVAEPKAALEDAITRRLAEHRDEVVRSYSLCPHCESEYLTAPVSGSCESRRGEGHNRCGTELVRMYCIDQSQNSLREQAGFQLARLGDITSRRAVVCAWLTQDLRSSSSADDEIKLPLAEVLVMVLAEMQRLFDKMVHHLAAIVGSLPFRDRRNPLPRGETLAEKHQDYLMVRDKLQITFNWIRGLTRGHPEFVEMDEQYRAPKEFSPPIPLPVTGTLAEPWIRAVEARPLSTEQRAPSTQDRLDAIPPLDTQSSEWVALSDIESARFTKTPKLKRGSITPLMSANKDHVRVEDQHGRKGLLGDRAYRKEGRNRNGRIWFLRSTL